MVLAFLLFNTTLGFVEIPTSNMDTCLKVLQSHEEKNWSFASYGFCVDTETGDYVTLESIKNE